MKTHCQLASVPGQCKSTWESRRSGSSKSHLPSGNLRASRPSPSPGGRLWSASEAAATQERGGQAGSNRHVVTLDDWGSIIHRGPGLVVAWLARRWGRRRRLPALLAPRGWAHSPSASRAQLPEAKERRAHASAGCGPASTSHTRRRQFRLFGSFWSSTPWVPRRRSAAPAGAGGGAALQPQ